MVPIPAGSLTGLNRKGKQTMDTASKASILHTMMRRMGAGGADITLKDLSGANGLLLVFSRSADW